MPKMMNTFALSALLLITAPAVSADETYGDTIRTKLASGLSNLFLGILEIPKNVIKTANETNLLFGMTGGMIKGTAHMLGRTLSGVVDTFTFPVPTQPIANPAYVWEDWYVDTLYGPYFPIDKKSSKPVAAAGAMPPTPAARTAPPRRMPAAGSRRMPYRPSPDSYKVYP
jgi:putative exosortase-associated protein (TIGR04073 family)